MRELEPGQEIAGWKVRRFVAHGAFASVYQVARADPPADGALKLFRFGAPWFTTRLGQEMSALERVDHPNLARVLDHGILGQAAASAIGAAAESPFVVSRFIEGEPLARILGRARPMLRSSAIEVVGALASALDVLHAAGLLHRDLKPSNVMIPAAGGFPAAVLIDADLAGLLRSGGQTLPGELFGTPAYMSPEQVTGMPQGPASDVWGLAAVLYEMLVGRPPFDVTQGLPETARAIVLEQVTFPVGASVDQAVREVIERGLAKDPSVRFPSAGEFAEALCRADRVGPKAIMSAQPAPTPQGPAEAFGPGPSGPPLPTPKKPPVRRSPMPLPAAGAIGLGAASVIGAVAWLGATQPSIGSHSEWFLVAASGAGVGAVAFAVVAWAKSARTRARSALAAQLGVARHAGGRRALLTQSLAFSVDRLIELTRGDPRASLVSASLALALDDYRRAEAGGDRSKALEEALKLFDALDRVIAGQSWLERNQKILAIAAGALALVGTASTQVGSFIRPEVRLDACPPRALSPGERFTFAPVLSRDADKLVEICVWSVDGAEAHRGPAFTWQAPLEPKPSPYLVRAIVPGRGSAACKIVVARP